MLPDVVFLVNKDYQTAHACGAHDVTNGSVTSRISSSMQTGVLFDQVAYSASTDQACTIAFYGERPALQPRDADVVVPRAVNLFRNTNPDRASRVASYAAVSDVTGRKSVACGRARRKVLALYLSRSD